MTQIYKQFTGGGPPGTAVETLSSEGGPNTPPSLANNYNFSGSTAGGSAANGAIEFITPGGPLANENGQMDAIVRVDGTTITINGSNQLVASGAFKWTVTASTSFTPANNTGYILVGGSMASVNLPVSPTADYWFAVVDQSGNHFTIVQNNGDSVQLGDDLTTTGVGGSIVSTMTGDTISMVCWASGPGASWMSIWPLGQFEVN